MNYGELKTHFEALLNRSDITSALTTTFIDQGIARIQRQLRAPINEKKVEYTISQKETYVTLPQDFLEIISLYQKHHELQRTTTSQYRKMQDEGAEGVPQYFLREQQRIYLYPAPTSGTLTLYYYCDFPQLSDDQDENDLTTVASDLIIYAALTYAADYYLDERSSIFEAKYNQFLTEIQEQANDQELNGGTQSIQPSYSYGDEYNGF
jgi:hypothetical protein